MVVRHRHAVEHFRINGIFIDINEVHLLADALHGRLGTQRGHVRPHEAVRVPRDGLGVDVIIQLHVPRVNSENLQAAVLVGHADVDLAVEAAEAS